MIDRLTGILPAGLVLSWQRATSWLGSAPSRRFCFWIFALYALHVVSGLAAHAMWRDELQAWLIVRDASSLGQLLHNLSYEGHPIGWYLLIWPLRLLGHDPRLMQIAQATCALGTVAVLLWRGPFSRLELVLLVLSYPIAFEYAVKSRSYGLGNLLLFAFCVAFVARRSVLLLAVLLALLVNVHAMFGLIALGGAAAIAVRRWRETGWRSVLSPADLPALLVFALGCASAVAVAHQPADSGYAVGWRFDFARAHLQETLSAFAAVIGQAMDFGRLSNLAPYAGLALVVLALSRGAWKPVAGAFFAVSVLALTAFLHVKYSGAVWHHSLLFMILVAGLWLARGEKGADRPTLLPRPVILLVLALQAWSGLHSAVSDRFRPYSAGRETARILVENGLEFAPLFGLNDYAVASVVAYLGAPSAFYGSGMRAGTFTVWDKARLQPVDVGALVDRAAATPGAVVLWYGDTPSSSASPPDRRLIEWRRVPGITETCLIYRIAG
jgi:hypothetical protein